MNREPRAGTLLAEGLSRVADGVGLTLLVLLGWRMFFVFDSALQEYALVVGAIGVAACWADRRALKNAPVAMLAYVAIALLSAAVHRWPALAASADPVWLSLFAPGFHLVVMAVFVYGAAHLLRTPARLSWFVVLLVTAIAALSVQIVFDRAAAGFVYVRGGPSLPSVPQWGGIHGTSLLLTMGLPLASVMMVMRRTVWQAVAGAILAAGLLGTAYLNGSRGGLVAMALVIGAMILFAVVGSVSRRWQTQLMAAGVAVLSVGLVAGIWFLRSNLEHGQDLSGRTLMWDAASRLILDHPWLGVGPGNYYQAIVSGGYAKDFPSHYAGLPNAHNLLLHVAAEAGVIGALGLVLLMAWALRACWRTWRAGYLPMVSLGLMFALGGFLAHSLTENFLDARAEVERTRLVVWMVLAAVLAVERLPRSIAAGRS